MSRGPAIMGTLGSGSGLLTAFFCMGLCSATYLSASSHFVASAAVLSLFLGPIVGLMGALVSTQRAKPGGVLMIVGGVLMAFAFGPANAENFIGSAMLTLAAGIWSFVALPSDDWKS